MLASPDDAALRHSVLGLAVSTAVAVGLLVAASFFDGLAQGALWALALFLDMAGPYFFGAEGWKLVPGHFAERHGLIVIIALGESIVALGIGAAGELDLGIGTVAVLGVALAAAQWWTYFDVVALVSARRLAEAEPGRVQNELARDSYSYLHLRDGRRDRARRLRAQDDDRATPTSTSTTCPRSPCSAASRSTCSAWSPSATATSRRSTASGSASRSCC